MQEIQLKVKCTNKEARKAISYWLIRFQKMVAIWVYVSCPLNFLVGVLALCFTGERNAPIYHVSFWWFLAFMHLLSYYVIPLGYQLRTYRNRQMIIYTFSDDHIATWSIEVESKISWPFLKKAHETPAAFLLVDSQDFVHIFPKRCFENETDLEAFRALLERKLDMLPMKRGRRAEKA